MELKIDQKWTQKWPILDPFWTHFGTPFCTFLTQLAHFPISTHFWDTFGEVWVGPGPQPLANQAQSHPGPSGPARDPLRTPKYPKIRDFEGIFEGS